jgi:hypothetical protein
VKGKKGRRVPLDPEAVLTGRVRPPALSLLELIRDVNPTGRGLSAEQAARRYIQKSRLQSLFVTRFRDEIDVHASLDEPGVVSLLHRPSGLDACHAVLAELDEDARSWVQYRLDLEASEPPPPPERKAPARESAPREGARGEREVRRSSDGGDLDVRALLEAGREAALAYAYDAARERFEAALERSSGAPPPAAALLSLLVDHLGADEEALSLEGRLSAEALDNPEVRILLALAAARRAERERALRFLNEHSGARGGLGQGSARRTGPRPARGAEVLVAIARGAIAEGRLDEAAEDLAQAREHDPTHPELRGLLDALAKRRAEAREPAEAALRCLFATGDIAGAERATRELLARFPDSDVGRRTAHAIAEQRRREQAGQILASAREALDAGETTRGFALLRQALASGLDGEDAAWVERRIAAIEEETRAREEHARIEDVRRLLAAGNVTQGLPAYAALDAPGRQVVRGSSGSPLLLWLDALAPPGQGARTKAAILAALALERAAELSERDPRAALDALSAHAKVLQGFAPAEKVSQAARRTLVEQRRHAARQAAFAARSALAEGKPDRADERLREAPLLDLPDEERSAVDALWASIRKLLKQRGLAASLEQLRRAGDDLRALSVVAELLALAEDTDKAPLVELGSELRERVQRTFCVHVEDLAGGSSREPKDGHPGGVACDPLWDATISANFVSRTLLAPPAPAPAGLEGDVLVLAQTKASGVFLRLVDVATAKLRARVLLRTPTPIELLTTHLLGRHLLLVGRRGSLLELSLDSFHVERWCPNIVGIGDAFHQSIFTDSANLPSLPEVTVEDTTLGPDGQSLWVSVAHHSVDGTRRALHVLELPDLRLIREIREPRGEHIYARPVSGLKEPRMAVVLCDEDTTKLLDARGQPTGVTVTNVPMASNTITACPDGQRLFTVVFAPAELSEPQERQQTRAGWVEIAEGIPSPTRLFEGMNEAYQRSALTSLDAGMVFILFAIEQKGCELFGLRQGEDGLEVAYRTTLPRRSMLLGDPESRRAAVLLAEDDRLEIVELGTEPPAPRGGPEPLFFHLPRLPLASGSTFRFTCEEPTGARLAAVTAVAQALRRETPSALRRRVDTALRRAGPEELLTLETALLRNDDMKNARLVATTVRHRFPEHPRARLYQGRRCVGRGQWSEGRALLSSVDPACLDKSEVQHLYHLRATALLMLDEPEAALAELTRAESCEEGLCELGEGIALCTPLSDTSAAWTSKQARLRDLMALIVSADAALAQGDASAARRVLDCLLVWEANEIQSLARLAEACMLEDEAGDASDPFRRTLTLLSFCELFAWRDTFVRREIPLPRVAWSTERLAAVAKKARARAEEALMGLAARHAPAR